MTPTIDWSRHDKFPEGWCSCRCGLSFMSHNKSVAEGDTIRTYTRKPCPACGRDDDCYQFSSPPESYTIHGPSGSPTVTGE